MVEGSSLENYRARERAVGSNPTLSAIAQKQPYWALLPPRSLQQKCSFLLLNQEVYEIQRLLFHRKISGSIVAF